jgi:uncharacterized phage protein (TIGR02220 family)
LYRLPEDVKKSKSKERVQRYRALQSVTGALPSVSVSSSELSINSINKESIVLIVDFLNQICGTSYRATSEKTAKHINARLNEKFTVEDFKAVIRFKSEQWGEDEKMKEYLRPETLFGTRFESYLQAAKAAGYVYVEHTGYNDEDDEYVTHRWIRGHSPALIKWNPLSDDGDALRLAVKLNLIIECMVGQTAARSFDNLCAGCVDHADTRQYPKRDFNPDPNAATRRAIVRAAAEIGRAA